MYSFDVLLLFRPLTDHSGQSRRRIASALPRCYRDMIHQFQNVFMMCPALLLSCARQWHAARAAVLRSGRGGFACRLRWSRGRGKPCPSRKFRCDLTMNWRRKTTPCNKRVVVWKQRMAPPCSSLTPHLEPARIRDCAEALGSKCRILNGALAGWVHGHVHSCQAVCSARKLSWVLQEISSPPERSHARMK
jgi:hypothetical protein